MVRVDEGCSFVLADIPGIIEGRPQGVGLGHDFLRHIDRCRLLVHLVDAAGSEGRDPVADFAAINQELKEYSEELAQRPQLVVANKIDLAQDGGAGAQALEAARPGPGLGLCGDQRRSPAKGAGAGVGHLAAAAGAAPGAGV